jgi:hypothetical protein
LLPFVFSLSDYLRRVGPDLEQMLPILQPLLVATTTVLRHLDLSALISQALGAVTPDGTLHVRLAVK